MCVRALYINYGFSNRMTVALSLAQHMLHVIVLYSRIWRRDFSVFLFVWIFGFIAKYCTINKHAHCTHRHEREYGYFCWYNGTYYYRCCYHCNSLVLSTTQFFSSLFNGTDKLFNTLIIHFISNKHTNSSTSIDIFSKLRFSYLFYFSFQPFFFLILFSSFFFSDLNWFTHIKFAKISLNRR